MKVLVTGGGGFLGRAVVEKLAARGHSVRTVSRGDYPDLRALGVEHFRGDLLDRQKIEDAVAGCDVVVHAAAKPGEWGKYQDFYDANVTGTDYVIDACRKCGVQKLVFTSSPTAVLSGKPQEGIDESEPYPQKYYSPYAETKAISEQHVMAANDATLATVSLRPRLVWGARDPNILPRITEMQRQGRLRIIGTGEQKIDCTYIDNASEAHVLAVDKIAIGSPIAGKVYFISNGEPIAVKDFINKIMDAYGLPPVTAHVPFGVVYNVGAMCESLYRSVGAKNTPPMTRMAALAMGIPSWFSIEAARRDLGYNPEVSIETGMKLLKEQLSSGD